MDRILTMFNKAHILFFLFLFVHFRIHAQVQNTPPLRQVLGTTGGNHVFTWGSIDYTIGECFVTTDTFNLTAAVRLLTQGFQQPNDIDPIVIGDSIQLIITNSPCIGANQGSVTLFSSYKNWPGNVTMYVYTQHAGINDTILNKLITSAPPSNKYSLNVQPGTYHYTVKIMSASGNNSISNTITIIEEQVPCLNFYNGITPNGDGINDTWIIDEIEYYKNNTVTIFNRWGDVVWRGTNYDNKNVVWSGKELPDATYFYLVNIEDKVYKGWIELTH